MTNTNRRVGGRPVPHARQASQVPVDLVLAATVFYVAQVTFLPLTALLHGPGQTTHGSEGADSTAARPGADHAWK
jgi:hypothetical protein